MLKVTSLLLVVLKFIVVFQAYGRRLTRSITIELKEETLTRFDYKSLMNTVNGWGYVTRHIGVLLLYDRSH
jgi:hypothetical protein